MTPLPPILSVPPIATRSIDAEAPNAKEPRQIDEVLVGRVRASRGVPRGPSVVGKDRERAPLAFRNATDDFPPIAPIVEGAASLFERIDRSRGILRDGKSLDLVSFCTGRKSRLRR
jgi:hypothetical protein